MNRLKKPISIYSVARMLTPEEIKDRERTSKLRKYLGIYIYLDDKSSHTQDEIVPSNYNSLESYERDKDYADDCIFLKKEIPKHIVQKLVTARKELESLGVLKR